MAYVGIVSPSFGAAGMFPHRVERGVAQLEALGYKVKLAKHALSSIWKATGPVTFNGPAVDRPTQEPKGLG